MTQKEQFLVDPVIRMTGTPGKIVSFNTDLKSPMAVKAEFAPVQDLNGYDSPWPAGGGKNLLDPDSYTLNPSKYIDWRTGGDENWGSEWYSTSYIPIAPGQYTISGSLQAQKSEAGMAWYDSEKTYINGAYITNAKVVTFTIPENGAYIRFSSTSAKKVQIETGATATPYAPYSNECPISGWDGCKVFHSAGNVWDEECEKGALDTSTGEEITSNSQLRAKNYIPVIGGATYYFVGGNKWTLFYDEDKALIKTGLPSSSPSANYGRCFGNAAVTMPSNCKFIRFYLTAGYGTTYNHDLAINYPSSVTTYNGTHTFSLIWHGTGADPDRGVIYGGYAEVFEDGSGRVTANVDQIAVPRDLSSYPKTYTANRGVGIRNLITRASYMAGRDDLTAMCNFAEKCTPINQSYMASQDWTFFKGSWTSVEEFVQIIDNMYEDGIIPNFVWKLRNPVTYPLTAQQMKTFLGANCVWTDLNGDISELKYLIQNNTSGQKWEYDNGLELRRRAIIANAPHQDSVTDASIASFTADFPAPMAVKAEFEPVQDLHGYDNPWPAGGGKNLYGNGDIEITESSGIKTVELVNPLPAGTYTISAIISSSDTDGSTCIIRFRSNSANITDAVMDRSVGTARVNKTVTLTDQATKVNFYAGPNTAGSAGDTASFINIQIETGSSATSYAPYENVCPISGWDGVTVWRTGKNLLDWKTKIQDNLSSVVEVEFIPIDLPRNTTLTYSDDYGLWNGKGQSLAVTTAKNGSEWASAWKENIVDGNYPNRTKYTFTTPDTDEQLYLRFYSNQKYFDYCTWMQIELGSENTAYVPYNGTSISLSFGSTLYSGTLDVLTGVVTVDKDEGDFGGYNWEVIDSDMGLFRTATSNLSADICDSYPIVVVQSFANMPDKAIRNYASRIYVKDSTYAGKTAAEFKAAVTGIKFIYTLATPITYPLTAEQIKTLLGTNNVWSDLNGSVTVRFFKHG